MFKVHMLPILHLFMLEAVKPKEGVKKLLDLQQLGQPDEFNIALQKFMTLAANKLETSVYDEILETLTDSALKDQNFAVLDACLAADNDLLTKELGRFTLMYIAISKNDLAAVRWMLDNGATPISVFASGQTSLHLACSLNRTEMACLLIERYLQHKNTAQAKAKAKESDTLNISPLDHQYFGQTALEIAFNNQNSQLVDALQRAGATTTPPVILILVKKLNQMIDDHYPADEIQVIFAQLAASIHTLQLTENITPDMLTALYELQKHPSNQELCEKLQQHLAPFLKPNSFSVAKKHLIDFLFVNAPQNMAPSTILDSVYNEKYDWIYRIFSRRDDAFKIRLNDLLSAAGLPVMNVQPAQTAEASSSQKSISPENDFRMAAPIPEHSRQQLIQTLAAYSECPESTFNGLSDKDLETFFNIYLEDEAKQDPISPIIADDGSEGVIFKSLADLEMSQPGPFTSYEPGGTVEIFEKDSVGDLDTSGNNDVLWRAMEYLELSKPTPSPRDWNSDEAKKNIGEETAQEDDPSKDDVLRAREYLESSKPAPSPSTRQGMAYCE